MKKHLALITLALFVLCSSTLIFTYFKNSSDVASIAPSTVEVAEIPAPLSLEEEFPHVIAANSTLFTTLRQLEIPPQAIQEIVDAAKPVHNLARLHAGTRFQLFYKGDAEAELSGLQFRFSAIERLDIQRKGGVWTAEKITEQVDLQTVTFSGVVVSSLWESAIRATMDPNLISELADIFGGEVDFSREVRLHDRWRLSVEQKFVRGQPIGWGAILAAEYENAGTLHRAALFRNNGEEMGYFAPNGESLRKLFLKSPIRFGRITSGFNLRRFHPILKTRRPHYGVDYGAPIGTPIRSVGNGVVKKAGWSGGGGNVIQIRHNGTYQTAYKHLSKFAKGIKPGSRVLQGQVIGYVGNTGLSTGPHLHFEFYQNGKYIDPLGKKFPSADPIPRVHLSAFKTQAEPLLASLPAWETPESLASTDTKSPAEPMSRSISSEQ